MSLINPCIFSIHSSW